MIQGFIPGVHIFKDIVLALKYILSILLSQRILQVVILLLSLIDIMSVPVNISYYFDHFQFSDFHSISKVGK